MRASNTCTISLIHPNITWFQVILSTKSSKQLFTFPNNYIYLHIYVPIYIHIHMYMYIYMYEKFLNLVTFIKHQTMSFILEKVLFTY